MALSQQFHMKNTHDSIEGFLRRDPSISDCRLVSRKDLDHIDRSILYFVPSGQYSVKELKERLAQEFPENKTPDFWCPVNRLPFKQDGELDIPALAELPLVDELLLEKVEHLALANHAASNAVSFIGPSTEQIQPLYLDDLLPPLKKSSTYEASPGNDRERVSTELHKQSNHDSNEWLNSGETTASPQDFPGKQDFASSIAFGDEIPIDPNSPTLLPQVLLGSAEQTSGNRIFHIQSDGSEISQSYAELLEESRRIAGGLQNSGVQPGDKIILQLEASRDFLRGFWACQLGGFVPVPMPIARQYTASSAAVQKIIDTGSLLKQSIILSDKRLIPVLRNLQKTILQGFRVESIEELLKNEQLAQVHMGQPDDLALILLTSGSTGLPKAVCQSHRALLTRSTGWILANGDCRSDVTFNWMPLDHVGGIVMWHLRDMLLGCSQVHAPTEYILSDPLRWLDMIDQHRVTNTWAPNFAYGLVCDREHEFNQRQWDLSCIRYLLNGGEAIISQTARRFLTKLAPHKLSATAMLPSWGMSETCSGVTSNNAFRLESTSDDAPHVVVGRPIPGFAVRVVDDKNQCVPQGTTGILQVKGTAVTSGYYNAPDLTDQSFTDDGWFQTGDLGRLDQGSLTITGRIKDVIIINGINYSGPAIEQVVEEIEGIARSYVAACAVSDPRQGGRESLAVFFVPETDDDEELQDLLKAIRGKLASKTGISPDYLIPLGEKSIPKTSIGKIQREKLKTNFEAGKYTAEIKHSELLSETHCLPPWFFRRTWQQSNPLANLQFEPYETVLLVGGNPELNSLLEEKIRSAGANSFRVTSGQIPGSTNANEWQVRPQCKSDYQQLIDELRSQGRIVRNVVCMWSCISDQSTRVKNEDYTQEAVQTAQAVMACCQTWADNADDKIQPRILVLTNRAQHVRGESGFDYLSSPVAGLVKALKHESPEADFLHLDIDLKDGADCCTAITTELVNTWNNKEVAWRAGRRWVAGLESPILNPVVDDALNPNHPACFVITGGLGGIGVKLADYLLRSHNSHVLLIGRSTLDTQEMGDKAERLKVLAKLPGKIEYIPANVTNARSLKEAIETQLAKWEVPLAGIFHLAGNYHEKSLAEETADSLKNVFSPKIEGAIALSEIIKQNPEAFLVNFSSTTSLFVLGGSHVGAYAAANNFLDTFTAQLVSEGYRCFSLNWSAWRQTGMNQGNLIGDALRARGLYELDVEQALTSLRICLGQSPGQMAVGLDAGSESIQQQMPTTRGLSTIYSFYETENNKTPSQLKTQDVFGTEIIVKNKAVKIFPHNEKGDIDYSALQLMAEHGNILTVPPRTATEQKLSEIWQRILRLNSISIAWNFFEVGGQSIIATSLIAAVRAEYAVEWTLSDIFSAPTIEDQAIAIDKAIGSGKLEKISIPAISRDLTIPLSTSQQRLWFLNQVEPESAAYNITGSIYFQNTPDPIFVEKCLNSIIARHESLRTIFPQTDGIPEQKILDQLQIKIHQASLSPDQSKEDFMIQEGAKPFNLSEGPLIRAILLNESNGGFILLLTLHHIIADGWSMRVFFREFSRLFSGDRPDELPALDIQYVDYALWQQSRLEEGMYEKQTDYWSGKLKDVLSGFTLPTDFPRPKIQTYSGARVTHCISEGLYSEVRKMASSRGVTLFTFMLTVFKALLARYSQNENVLIGTVVANRDYPEIENLIGFLVNPVVLRSNITPSMSFIDLLDNLSQTIQDAYANHALPFERLVDQLQPARDTSRSPLFQIAFDLRDPEIVRSEVKGINFGIMEPDLGTSQYDLHLTLEQRGKELNTLWEFNTDLFSRSTIERMAENYHHLLSSVLAQPEKSISQLPLLSSTETELLQSWNECPAPFSDNLCMHQLFEQQVADQPEADALIFGNQRLSYAELNRRANQLAHYLTEQGAKPDKIIAICFDRSIEMIVSVLAVLKSGAAYLALDPTYPSDRLAFMIEDSGVSLLLSNANLSAHLPKHSAKVIEVDKTGEHFSHYQESNPDSNVKPSHLAYVIYTSGSTGKPKGVLVEHHGWCNVAEAQKKTFGLNSGMRVLQFASLSFDASAFEFSMAWGSGGALCLGTQEQLLPGPNLVKMLQNNSVEVVTLPPTALGAMPDSTLPDLKVITVAGEACPQDLVHRWTQPGRRFFNLYGPTETTIWASYAECYSNISSPPPIGKPVANMRLYVVDPQMQRLPIGMPGELCIGGEGVTRGYLNRPELNEERFVVNTFNGDHRSRIYRSGDLARFLPDGNLEFLGRMDHQVKIRGHRVELGEIESQLRSIPGVGEAVVLARIAEDGERQLLAYASPADQVQLNSITLRDHLRKILPQYMIPSQIIILDQMPLSPNGKVDRKALPDPKSHISKAAEISNKPQTEMEQIVSRVWQKILQLDSIDVHQNFFDLGGHSMKMAQAQTALSQELQHEVPLVDLFQYPTISTLAAHFGGDLKEKVTTAGNQEKQRTSHQEGRNRLAQLAALSRASRKKR